MTNPTGSSTHFDPLLLWLKPLSISPFHRCDELHGESECTRARLGPSAGSYWISEQSLEQTVRLRETNLRTTCDVPLVGHVSYTNAAGGRAGVLTVTCRCSALPARRSPHMARVRGGGIVFGSDEAEDASLLSPTSSSSPALLLPYSPAFVTTRFFLSPPMSFFYVTQSHIF